MYGGADENDGNNGNNVEYSETIELNLDEIEPSVAGPKRPQDRIPLSMLKQQIHLSSQNQRVKVAMGSQRLTSKPSTRLRNNRGRPTDCSRRGRQTHETARTEKDFYSEMNTNPWTEAEMINNRPTPDAIEISPDMYPGKSPD